MTSSESYQHQINSIEIRTNCVEHTHTQKGTGNADRQVHASFILLSQHSLLHRPLFTKLFTPAEPSLFPTTKHIISPAIITRKKMVLLKFGF